mmetsp:Transcript_44779/g.126653  ORF Transcript_44779/g.126653 Transcript_44779/m.126653 type:complete len:200 (+) Transcript_44779:122-721(+)
MMRRPMLAPGASWRRLRRVTLAVSTPGMFRIARTMPLSSAYTTRGPRRMTYLRFRIFPWPARIFFESTTFCSSSAQPTPFRNSRPCFVFWMDSRPSVTTSGSSWTSPMRCPRAMTSGGSVLAASAETTACRFWVMFTCLCQRLQIFVGLNMPPPRAWLPKAAWPARWVPPPGTRGIRDTARPVPQDSAAVSYPTLSPTA